MRSSQTTEYLLNKGIKNTHYKLALVHNDRRNTEGSLLQLPRVFGPKKWALSVCQAKSQWQKVGDVVDAAW